MTYYGGIEAGGTKFNCIIASGPQDIVAETRIPTTTPQQTLEAVIDFYRQNSHRYPLHSMGISCFGPVELDPQSPVYGSITSTPKPGWANTPITTTIEEALGIPVAFDTDVNGAAFGEGAWGAAQGLKNFLYITIGTGVGGGCFVNGQPVHGLVHPEMGHIALPHNYEKDPFEGSCPFHKDCFEGMASGPALQKRWGKPASELSADHPAWELEAHYIAIALHNFICTLSPQRIILGGGVMSQEHLFPLIRQKTMHMLNQYVQSPAILEHIDQFIVPPGLGSRAGVLGSLAMALQLAG